MLKKRFGEDFYNQVSANLEIKTQEQARKVQKTDKRKGGKDFKKQPR